MNKEIVNVKLHFEYKENEVSYLKALKEIAVEYRRLKNARKKMK